MNPITPWAQDAVDKVRYQAGEYRRRKAERAALEARVQAASHEMTCRDCGYIQCSCAYNSMIRVYRSMFLDTTAGRDDGGPSANVITEACGDAYSRPRAGPRLTYGPVMTMDGKPAALSLGEAGRKLRAAFDVGAFDRNYFASFEAFGGKYPLTPATQASTVAAQLEVT